MNPIAQQAREAHRNSVEHSRLSAHYRQHRDQLIRQLHAGGDWSYGRLARHIGCSRELIAKIVQDGHK